MLVKRAPCVGDSKDRFTYILQGCFTGNGAILTIVPLLVKQPWRMYDCPSAYGVRLKDMRKIERYPEQNTTKHTPHVQCVRWYRVLMKVATHKRVSTLSWKGFIPKANASNNNTTHLIILVSLVKSSLFITRRVPKFPTLGIPECCGKVIKACDVFLWVFVPLDDFPQS